MNAQEAVREARAKQQMVTQPKLNNNYSEANDEIRQVIRKIFNRPDMSNELITTYLRHYSVYKREYLKRL